MKKYPKVNYIGNKEKLASWICSHFPSEVNSIADAFSGGASVSYEAKRRGFEVHSNDILKVNFHIAEALIENSKEILDPLDCDLILSGKPLQGFMHKNYSEVFFYPEECKDLDLYRENVNKLSNDYKKSLALILLRRSMIRKMPYSRFTINWEKIVQLRDEDYSYSKYGRRRAYHNESIRSHFNKNLAEYNNAVFDNDRQNKAYNLDVFDFLKRVDVDLVYLDPPYTGTMNNYHGFYGALDNYIDGTFKEPFKNNFIHKQESVELFHKLFQALSKFKYWILSYNNRSYPEREMMLEIINSYSSEVLVVEQRHDYKITGRSLKDTNVEYLFVVKN